MYSWHTYSWHVLTSFAPICTNLLSLGPLIHWSSLMTAHVPLLLPCSRDRSLILHQISLADFFFFNHEEICWVSRNRNVPDSMYFALYSLPLRGGWTITLLEGRGGRIPYVEDGQPSLSAALLDTEAPGSWNRYWEIPFVNTCTCTCACHVHVKFYYDHLCRTYGRTCILKFEVMRL